MINPYLIEQIQKYPNKFNYTGIMTSHITSSDKHITEIKWFTLSFLNIIINGLSTDGSDWTGNIRSTDQSFIEYVGNNPIGHADYFVSFSINEETINILKKIKPSK